MSYRKILLVFLVLFCFAGHFRTLEAGADCCDDYYYYSSSPAYCESANAAHWTAYVPVAALIIAAVCFGFADRNHEHCSTSSSSHSGHRSCCTCSPSSFQTHMWSKSSSSSSSSTWSSCSK